MIKLSVNVNKIATLRNSRGGKHPNVVEFSEAAILAGAHGITVHPRPDERHIRYSDTLQLAELTRGRVEFNIEGYPDERYHELVAKCRPQQATLVPDPPDALTSNAGWNVVENLDYLRETVSRLKHHTERVSLFLEPDLAQVEAAAKTGADRIEFYTEPFAIAFEEGRGSQSFQQFNTAAIRAAELGLGINAGHDLNLHNMVLLRKLHGLAEVSIGHALVVDALWMGWKKTVRAYLDVLAGTD
jgi:pyridoxine 5-phosphate synthase